MEDLERYRKALNRSVSVSKKIIDTLEEDKRNVNRGLSGEPEAVYMKQCNQAIDEIRKIQKKAWVLYSESSTGL